MTANSSQQKSNNQAREARRQLVARYFPLWLIGGTLFVLFLPDILSFAVRAVVGGVRSTPALIVDGAAAAVDGLELAAESAGEALVFSGELLIHVAAGTGYLATDAAEFGGEALRTVHTTLNGFLTPTTNDQTVIQAPGEIAPLFTQEIDYWEVDILRWAETYDLDPNLLATVMQIESCGHPTVSSHAGAQGLFQVMPMHFASDEDQLDPNTNAMRGASVLNSCLDMADGDAAMAMACYNGGPSVLFNDMATWLDEPRRYYYWGQGIYTDALADNAASPRLDEWLNAGGARLCGMASTELGID